MSSTHPTHSIALLDEVQKAIAEAAYLASGYDIGKLKHCHVQISSNYRNSGDMKSNVAAALFLMHTARNKNKECLLRKKEEEQEDNNNAYYVHSDIIEPSTSDSGVMEVVTTSRYGLVAPRRYTDASSLAESIILLIPEEAMQTTIAHAFVQPGAKNSCHIVIITKVHMAWQLNIDKLHCVTCGKFFKGSRGLRTHEIIDHKFATEDARQDALDSELQMVLYVPPLTLLHAVEAKPLTTDINDLGDEGLNLVRRGDLAGIQALMRSKAGSECIRWDPLSARDKHGNTCLTWAAGEGHLEMCRYFVDDCGMDPLVRTGARKRQRQALHWAARNGHIDVCAWLIREKGADVDVGTDDGSTPLHLAIWNHQPACVKWLIEECGSDVNRRNSHGCNASQWAALSGNISMLKYLKEKGLDLTILNANGRSAVHKAGLKGHLVACQWLLTPLEEGGAGLGLRHVGPDVEGDTPASLAKSNGHSLVEQWLLEQQSRLLNSSQDTFLGY